MGSPLYRRDPATAPKHHEASDDKITENKKKILGLGLGFVYFSLDGHAAGRRGICC